MYCLVSDAGVLNETEVAYEVVDRVVFIEDGELMFEESSERVDLAIHDLSVALVKYCHDKKVDLLVDGLRIKTFIVID